MTRLDERIALMSLAPQQTTQWTWPATSCRLNFLDSPMFAGTGSTNCHSLADLEAYVDVIGDNDVALAVILALGESGVIIPVAADKETEAVYYCEPTTSSFRIVQESRKPGAPTKPVDEMVAHIRSSFGLNVSDTARALKVERPTIYAWLSGKSSPHQSNLHRLVVLEHCAQRWDDRSSMPAKKLIKIPLAGGRTLLELLQQEPLDEADILHQIDVLAQQAGTTKKPSLRERLRARGESLPSVDDQRDVIDTITGRRIDID